MAESAPSSRPLSPHLQIWRFTITMAASITHRGAGVAMYFGIALLAIWLFAAASGYETFRTVSGLLNSTFGNIVIAGLVWSLSFHLINGLRYLYWDSGRGFKVETARATGWAAFIGSFVLAGLILFLGHAARGGA